jgi:hypothetical protein
LPSSSSSFPGVVSGAAPWHWHLQQLMDITPAAISTCASLRIAPKRKIGICRDVGRVLEAGAVNAADYIGRGAEKSKMQRIQITACLSAWC